MQRILKITAIIAAGLIIILVLLFLFISTGALNSQIAETASSIAGKSINGKVEIGRIEGNLFSKFKISDISVKHENDTILKLDQFELNYSLSRVIRKNIVAELTVINGLHLNLDKDENGMWNFQKLMPEPDTTKQEKISKPLAWKFCFPSIQLQNIMVINKDEPSSVPKITKFNADLSFNYSHNNLSAKLEKFNLISKEPDLIINRMTIETSMSDSVLSWNGFEIEMPATNLISKGSVPLNKIEQSVIDLEISPLAIEDMEGWIEGFFGSPEIKLHISKNDDADKKGSKIYFSLKEQNQSVVLSGDLFETDNMPACKIILETNNINAAHWTGNPEMFSNITGSMQINGEGFNIKENNVSLDAKFTGVQYDRYQIDSLTMNLNKSENNYDALVNATTPWGKIFSDIQLNNKQYQINRITLQNPVLTAGIDGTGNLEGSHNVNLTLNINTTDTSLTFPVIPKNINLKSTLKASLSGITDSIHLDASLHVDTISMEYISAGNLSAKLISDFSPEKLIAGNTETPDKNIYDDFLNGLFFVADISTRSAAYSNYNIDSSSIQLEKKYDTVSGTVNIHSSAGNLGTHFKVGEIFSSPVYLVNASLKNADLSKIILNEAYTTDLNFDFLAEGKGIKPGNAMISLDINSIGSSVFGYQLEDFSSDFQLDNYQYRLSGLLLETPFMLTDISGEGNFMENNNLSFLFKTKDAGLLAPVTGIESPDLKGVISGFIKGPADSLNINALANFNTLEAGELSVENIIAEVSLNIKDSIASGLTRLKLNNTQIKDFTIEKLDAKSTFDEAKAVNSINVFFSDSLRGTIKTEFLFSEDPTLVINELFFKIHNNEWKKTDSPSTIMLLKDTVSFSNIEINSKNSFVKIDGTLASQGDENFNIEVRDVKLIPVPGIQLLPFPVSGTVNGHLNISGTASLPVISFNASAGSLKLNDVQFEEVRLGADYNNDKLFARSYIERSGKKLFKADGELPINISIANKELKLTKNGDLAAVATIDQLDLSLLNSFIPLQGAEAQGSLSAKAEIKDKVEKPVIKGVVSLANGAFRYARFGINYKDIGIQSSITNNNIIVDSLQITSGKGDLNLKGSLESDTLYNGSFKDINISITGNNFRLLDSDLLRAEITTAIHVTGSSVKPVLGGKLIIKKANLNTDLFLKEFDRVSDDLEEPLLIEAREQAQKVKFHQTAVSDTTKQQLPDIMNNLSGEFDIEIPGNVWIKGKNMNFEVNGMLKAVMQVGQIDLFGSMNVKRGYYKLYGKRLDFEEGEVTLTGGKDIDPQLNFNIAYRFRDIENILRKLNIKVTGKVSNPQLSFFLDGSPLQEKDAISYLLFNKSSNQLDSRENSSIKGSNLDIARDLALGQLSNVVKDVLQSSLGLDVIEISGEEGWTQGSISIGKYITNNLFLSYQRTFAMDKKNKQIEPEKISLEYQLIKSLFLQATNQGSNSGFDFIYKWTWK